MIEGSPVLQGDDGAAETKIAAEQSQFLIRLQLAQHSGHGHHHRKPFVNFEGSIDTHSDEEHTKLAVHPGGHSLSYDW